MKLISKGIMTDEELTLSHLRIGRTKKAVQKCEEWLAFCLQIGWGKDELTFLETIWWKHRNKYGNLLKK